MLNNFEKFSFPSIEKRWTKDKETDGQKEKRQEKTKMRKREKEKERKKEKKKKRKKRRKRKNIYCSNCMKIARALNVKVKMALSPL